MTLEIQLKGCMGDKELLPHFHSIAPGSVAQFLGQSVLLDCGDVSDPAQVRINLHTIPSVVRVDWVE